MSSVLEDVDPSGNCICVNITPLSSSGKNPDGITLKSIAIIINKPINTFTVNFELFTKYCAPTKYLSRIPLNQLSNLTKNSFSTKSSLPFKIVEHNAGVKVNATIVDKPIADAIQ